MENKKNELDLRRAFPDMPDSCYTALMDSVSSVQEDTRAVLPVRRLILAAAAVMLMVATGVTAAVKGPGWSDLLERFGLTVSEKAGEIMDVSVGQSWQVGPVTLTVKQQIADPKIVMTALEIKTSNGNKALFMPTGDISEPVGKLSFSVGSGDVFAVSADSTWGEAAKQLDVPLYRVRGSVETDSSSGLSIEDTMQESADRVVYFDMLQLQGDLDALALRVKYIISVDELDPNTGEVTETWTDRDHEAEIPVQPLIAEKTYTCPEDSSLSGLRITDISAQQYVTGLYVKLTLAKDSDIEDDVLKDLMGISFTDTDGDPYPAGMNLTVPFGSDTEDWEGSSLISLEFMLDTDHLPDGMKLVYEDQIIDFGS